MRMVLSKGTLGNIVNIPFILMLIKLGLVPYLYDALSTKSNSILPTLSLYKSL